MTTYSLGHCGKAAGGIDLTMETWKWTELAGMTRAETKPGILLCICATRQALGVTFFGSHYIGRFGEAPKICDALGAGCTLDTRYIHELHYNPGNLNPANNAHSIDK